MTKKTMFNDMKIKTEDKSQQLQQIGGKKRSK